MSESMDGQKILYLKVEGEGGREAAQDVSMIDNHMGEIVAHQHEVFIGPSLPLLTQ